MVGQPGNEGVLIGGRLAREYLLGLALPGDKSRHAEPGHAVFNLALPITTNEFGFDREGAWRFFS